MTDHDLRQAALILAHRGLTEPSEAAISKEFHIGTDRSGRILEMAHELVTTFALGFFGRANFESVKEWQR